MNKILLFLRHGIRNTLVELWNKIHKAEDDNEPFDWVSLN